MNGIIIGGLMLVAGVMTLFVAGAFELAGQTLGTKAALFYRKAGCAFGIVVLAATFCAGFLAGGAA